jgi:hypothetical protein
MAHEMGNAITWAGAKVMEERGCALPEGHQVVDAIKAKDLALFKQRIEACARLHRLPRRGGAPVHQDRRSPCGGPVVND